jgi:hypothetical protein
MSMYHINHDPLINYINISFAEEIIKSLIWARLLIPYPSLNTNTKTSEAYMVCADDPRLEADRYSKDFKPRLIVWILECLIRDLSVEDHFDISPSDWKSFNNEQKLRHICDYVNWILLCNL